MKLGTPLIRYESNHLRHEKFIKSCCKNIKLLVPHPRFTFKG